MRYLRKPATDHIAPLVKLNTTMRLHEINRIAQSEIDQRLIKEKIRYCLGVGKRQRLGKIDGVNISYKNRDRETYFVFSEDRTASGFAILQHYLIGDYDGHFVSDIGLLDPLRFRGIGLQFYHMLIARGYTLFSGSMQTPDSEKLWKKLIADPSTQIRLIDMQEPDEELDIAVHDPWSDPYYILVAS